MSHLRHEERYITACKKDGVMVDTVAGQHLIPRPRGASGRRSRLAFLLSGVVFGSGCLNESIVYGVRLLVDKRSGKGQGVARTHSQRLAVCTLALRAA